MLFSNEDPHGARGSTEHHALDYELEVKAFSSAELLASLHATGDSASGSPLKAEPKPVEPKPPTAMSSADAPPPGTSRSLPTFHALDFKGEVSATTFECMLCPAHRRRYHRASVFLLPPSMSHCRPLPAS